MISFGEGFAVTKFQQSEKFRSLIHTFSDLTEKCENIIKAGESILNFLYSSSFDNELNYLRCEIFQAKTMKGTSDIAANQRSVLRSENDFETE